MKWCWRPSAFQERIGWSRVCVVSVGAALLLYACSRNLPAVAHADAPAPAPSPSLESDAGSAQEDTATSPEPAPTIDTPELNAKLWRLRAAAQERILGPGNALEDAEGQLAVNETLAVSDAGVPFRPDGYALGSFVAIENESALHPFHEALEQLQAGQLEGGKLRILAYGASHTQGDLMTGYLRYYLQSRFGNGGLGFVQLALVNTWYRPFDVKVESTGFRIQHAQRKVVPEHGRFGLLGAAAVGYSKYAFGRVLAVDGSEELGSQMVLHAMAEPRAGDLILDVDHRRVAMLPLRADPAHPVYHEFTVEQPWQRIEVRPRGNGTVRVFGVSIERPTPGIVIDTLGINGTRAANQLLWNEIDWQKHVQRRAPRLILLAYGTNETVDTLEPIAEYEANLRRVLERVKRAAPQASCVLVGPGDFPKEAPGGYVPRPRLTELIDIQRKLSFELDCGFFDTYAFMGGEDSMNRWASASPQMGGRDRIHFTRRGYVKWGMVLGDALLRAFDAKPERPETPRLAEHGVSPGAAPGK